MDVKYQVFVSSTFVDLQEERRKVIEQILNLGHIPVGMELFQAGDETQWSYIKRRILGSDYYVLIVAERYGSENNNGKSYTQMEYEFAIKNKIPSISFLLHNEARNSWPQSKIEYEKKEKIKSFRNICQKRLNKYWRNPDDLAAVFAPSLVELIREKPGIGWIKGSAGVSPQTTEEITRLSSEKRSLQDELRKYKALSEEILTPKDIEHQIEQLKKLKLRDFLFIRETYRHGLVIAEKFDLLKLFLNLSRKLALSMSVYELGQELTCLLEFPRDIAYESGSLVSEYIARNLVVITVESRLFNNNSSNITKYTLTEFGKKLLMYAEMKERA